MLKVGLTGGIGSGKSAASDHFARLGAEVIDTDQLSRELVEPGQAALAEILDAFGSEMLAADGRLDRDRLRERVFADDGARERLQRILHPRIRELMLARASDSTAPYVVFVIPLLIETGQQSLVDRVLLIDAPEDLQLTRVMARNGLDEGQVDAIVRAQTDRQTRLAHADDVVLNDAGLDKLYGGIEALHRRYLELVHK